MNNELSKYIADNYHKWCEVARNITKATRKTDWEDLLHDTLQRLLSKDENELLQLLSKNELDYYLIRSMYVANNSKRSSFHIQYRRFGELRKDFIEHKHELSYEWLGARLDNEQLDIAISRLHWFESTIFQCYLLDGFSYRELEKETGIPAMYLYRVVEDAKRKLKKHIKK